MLNVKFGNGSFEFDSTILVIYLKKLSYQKKYIYIVIVGGVVGSVLLHDILGHSH